MIPMGNEVPELRRLPLTTLVITEQDSRNDRRYFTPLQIKLPVAVSAGLLSVCGSEIKLSALPFFFSLPDLFVSSDKYNSNLKNLRYCIKCKLKQNVYLKPIIC